MSATSKMPCRSVILQREDISAGGTSKTVQLTQKQSKKIHNTNIRFEIRLRLSDSFTWIFFFFYYLLDSYMQVFPHLLTGDPQEGLTGPGVAEAACAHMNVVQTRHSVYLRKRKIFKISPSSAFA